MPEHGQHHVTAQVNLRDRMKRDLNLFMEEEREIDPRRAKLLELVLRQSHPVKDHEFGKRLNIGFGVGDYEYRINVDVADHQDLVNEDPMDLDSWPRVLATRVGGDLRGFVNSLPTDEQIFLIRLIDPEFHVHGLNGIDDTLDLVFPDGKA